MDANLSIFKKGLLLVAIPFLVQFLLLGVLAMIRADQAEAQRWAIHSKEVIAQAEAAQGYVVDAQSAVRGYILTSEPRFVTQFEQSGRKSTAALAALSQHVSDNPPQQQRVEEIAVKTTALVAWLAETVRLEQNKQSVAVNVRVRSLEGGRRTEEIRQLTQQFLDEEERLDAERHERLQWTTRKQNLALLGGAVLALFSTAILVYGFSRGIGNRLGALTANVRRFAAGQELGPVPEGRDEISEVDRAFRDMAESLVQKDRENEMFVYSVSHDLRSPLVNLQGFSQELGMVCNDLRGVIVANDMPPAARARALQMLDRDAAESIRYIQTAVTRLSGIIDALLRLSRVGRVEYRKAAVDVEAVVRRVVASLNDSIVQRGARVDVGPLPPAWADPTAVDQIFGNLVANAVYYLDPARPGTIEVGRGDDAMPEAPPGTHVYFVKDNGLGIAPEFREKVFLAFQRLHPKAAPGEGIGLALVRRVVERHGGKVWLTSEVGTGTTFFVALPAAAPDAAAQPQEAAA